MMGRSPSCFFLAVIAGAALVLACAAQSPMFAPCTYTSADGSYFDLSALTRSNSPEDYVMADAAGNSYILNVRQSHCVSSLLQLPPVTLAQVCGDAMVVPTACVDLEKIVPAPAYQVRDYRQRCILKVKTLRR
jgi:hypothetical protein